MATAQYAHVELTRAKVDATKGPSVLEFGATWCPICQGAQPVIEEALGGRALPAPIKVEDGSGRPLGRSFRIKLWPTLVFLHDGVEVARVVRPQASEDLADAVARLEDAGAARGAA